MKSQNFQMFNVSVVTPTTINTEFTVAHTMPSTIPLGYVITRRSKAAQLYRSSTAWTTSTAYFKSDTAAALFNVAFFV